MDLSDLWSFCGGGEYSHEIIGKMQKQKTTKYSELSKTRQNLLINHYSTKVIHYELIDCFFYKITGTNNSNYRLRQDQ